MHVEMPFFDHAIKQAHGLEGGSARVVVSENFDKYLEALVASLGFLSEVVNEEHS
jgi:hypothetical protein